MIKKALVMLCLLPSCYYFMGIIVPITCNCIDKQKQQKHILIEHQTKLIHKLSTIEPNDFALIKIALKKIQRHTK